MSADADIPTPDELLLARLAAMDFTAAELVHRRLMEAETTAEVVETARAYQGLSRAVRQTIALKAGLKRNRERDAAPARAAAQAAEAKRVQAVVTDRAGLLRCAVVRVIWDEVESAEAADELEDALEDHIDEARQAEGFVEEPLDAQVQAACEILGLSPDAAKAWRDLRDPPDAGTISPPAWRSSA